MEDIYTRIRNAQISALKIGQSPLTANLITAVTADRSAYASRILLAYYNRLEANNVPWTTPEGLFLMIRDFCAQNMTSNQSDEHTRQAHIAGSIIAEWTIQSMIPADAAGYTEKMNSERKYIAEVLREYIKQPADVLRPIIESMRIVRNKSFDEVQHWPRGELWSRLNDVPQTAPWKIEWVRLRLNSFPWTKLTTMTAAQHTAIHVSGVSGDITSEILGRIAMKPANEFRTAWKNLTDGEIVGVYECIGANKQDTDEARAIVAAAVFTGVTALCKSGNITPVWLKKRLDLFKESFGDVAIDEYVSVQSVQKFVQLYQPEKRSGMEIYVMIRYLYELSHNLSLDVIKWIIEQSRMSNITSAMGFGQAVRQHAVCTHSLLRRAGIPESEFRNLVMVMVHSISKPFSTLKAPYHPTSMYADVAYIGAKIAFSGRSAYKGTPETNASLPVAALDAMISSIGDSSALSAGQQFSVQSICQAFGLFVTPIRGDRYQVTTEAPSIRSEDGDVLTAGEHIVIRDAHAGEIIPTILNLYGTEKDRALKLICSEFVSAASQVVLPAVIDSKYCVGYNVTVTDEIKNAALLFLDLEEYTAATAQEAEIEALDGKFPPQLVKFRPFP